MRPLLIALLFAGCGHPGTPHFFARYVAPCGTDALEIAERPGGPFRLVFVRGDSPIRRLRYHALIDARVIVTGETIGLRADAECGELPELRVDDFRPWGPVHRVFSATALDGQLHVYTELLPRDRYAPEDLEGDAEPRLLDSDACQPRVAACPPGRVAQTDVARGVLCCPILP